MLGLDECREIFATSDDEDDLYDAIVDAGKGELKELEPEVRRFLNHVEEDLREAAIATLGMRWALPNFLEECEAIWRNDSNDNVRSTALHSWASYYFASKDKNIVKILYNVVKKQGEDAFVRLSALTGIIHVMGLSEDEFNIKELERSQNYQDFENMLPWSKLDQLLE